MADTFLSTFSQEYSRKQQETMSLMEYLELCKSEPLTYANAAGRLLDAIGKAEVIDTNSEQRLKNIYHGKPLKVYDAFKDFYGLDGVIEKIMVHLKGAASGSEFGKQVLFLLGPVGSAKTSLGERMKDLLETRPIYVLKSANEEDDSYGDLSPLHESPLGVLGMTSSLREKIHAEYGIPKHRLEVIMSPWAKKRLDNAEGDINKAFEVVKMFPSRLEQVAISEVDPQEESTQDVSAFIGKLNLNELGQGIDENDTDAYLYSGGFAVGNQGIIEMDEMLKMPTKVLNPVLKGIQSRHYQASTSIGPIPVDGLFIGQTNTSEYKKFFGNKDNEAMMDRMNVITVPYTLQKTNEAKIYDKVLSHEDANSVKIAPKTIDLLAKFSVMSRLLDGKDGANAQYSHKIRAEVLDGEMPDGPEAKIPSIKRLREMSDQGEGMSGISTRFAFKALTSAITTAYDNSSDGEVGIDPIIVMDTLKERIQTDDVIAESDKEKYISFVVEDLMPEYAKFVSEEIAEAFTNASDVMCQNMFDRYIAMANAWIDDETFDDTSTTGIKMDKDELNRRLVEIEAPARVPDPKSFRHDVTRHVMKRRAGGENVKWDSYEDMKKVIRRNLDRKMVDVMPIIQFDNQMLEGEQATKRDTFLENMKNKGYTMDSIRRCVALYQRMKA